MFTAWPLVGTQLVPAVNDGTPFVCLGVNNELADWGTALRKSAASWISQSLRGKLLQCTDTAQVDAPGKGQGRVGRMSPPTGAQCRSPHEADCPGGWWAPGARSSCHCPHMGGQEAALIAGVSGRATAAWEATSTLRKCDHPGPPGTP